MAAPLKILFVTSEIYPLVKTGGLADISGALPLALRKLGMDVRVLTPAYPPILEQLPDAKLLADVPPFSGPAGSGNTGAARLLGAAMPGSGLPLLLLDSPALFARPGGPYLSPQGKDWPDNVLRFGALCQAGALIASAASPLEWKPDIVHCNDWQSGLIPALLHYAKKPHAKSVMSIHNLMFQGNFDPAWVAPLGLPATSYAVEGVEFYGQFSFLKAGLYFAEQITTVSRTYAREIQTPAFGCGMEGLLAGRRGDLHGIVNGIGEDWNPATDTYLRQTYDRATLHKKATNKLELQREMKLKPAGDIPLLCLVSRLTRQKGIDLMLDCAPDLLASGAQLAVLGSGDLEFEQRLRGLATQYPGQIGITVGYDEGLAHRLIAGGDIFLMPSRFEPCGLAQMYAMAYGTLPVVRRTGGLADTVVDSDEAALHDGIATGFVFDGQSSSALMNALRRALALYREKDTWREVQQTGMARDFGWEQAATAYSEVYQAALQSPERQQPKPEQTSKSQLASKQEPVPAAPPKAAGGKLEQSSVKA